MLVFYYRLEHSVNVASESLSNYVKIKEKFCIKVINHYIPHSSVPSRSIGDSTQYHIGNYKQASNLIDIDCMSNYVNNYIVR